MFSLHDTRIKISYQNKRFIRNKNRMNSLWNDLYWNEMSSRYHVKKHREIFKDGMNSFQNESRSGIMGITPK